MREPGAKVRRSLSIRRRLKARLGREIAEASGLTREFLGLIHRRDVDGFDRWLVRARERKTHEVRRFAPSLTADLSAVRTAFELPSSGGRVKGQINRLKFLKRQIYG